MIRAELQEVTGGAEAAVSPRPGNSATDGSAVALPRPGEAGAPAAAEAVLRTLLLTDLVDSTKLVEKLGDARAFEIATRHDRVARDLLPRHRGLEIDKTDGFLLLFERPIDAVGYALAYHQALAELSLELGVQLRARAGIHLGEVFLRENDPEDVARGAKPLEVEGLAKPTAARVMSLAGGKQTLMTEGAFNLARQAVDGELARQELRWLAHGPYLFKGVPEPVEVFEVGVPGLSALTVPPDREKARRAVAAGDEITLGWRPGPGQEVPRRPGWLLDKRLGEGGFGEVWLAVQKSTGEPRVFKFCYDAERLRALQREVTLFRLLKESLGDRDEIVRIYDWNFAEAPYYLEAEYVAGGNLGEWADEQGGIGEVALAVRLEVAAQAADALAAAHSVGVLHKDVKPHNVLVTSDREGRPRVKLTDFGIGEVVDQQALLAKGITVLGLTEVVTPDGPSSVAGSHLYMAPEVSEGKAASVQADIYALGVMLYQMVVGDFRRALGPGWRRDVSDELLAEDIASFVDREPDRRPGSAREVAEKLRTLEERRRRLAAERQAAAEAEAARQALERAQRRRKIAAAVAAAAVVVLAVVSVLAVQAVNARDQAQTARRVADSRRDQAEDLIGFMLGDLRQKLTAVGRLEILEDVGDQAMAYFAAVPEEELSDEELFRRSRAISQIGEVRLELNNLATARQAFEEALVQAEGLVRRDPENLEWQLGLAHSHYWIGLVLWWRGDLDGAFERMQTYLEIARELVAREPANPTWQFELASAHVNIGQIQNQRGELAAALEQYTTFRTILEQKLVANDPANPEWRFHLANAYSTVGSVLRSMGQLERAYEQFRRELATIDGLVAQDPANTTWQMHRLIGHNEVGEVAAALGEIAKAREHFQTAVEISSTLVESDPQNRSWQRELAANSSWLCQTLQTLGDLRAALTACSQSVTIMEDLVAKDPGNVRWREELPERRCGQAEALLRLGEVSRAKAQVERAVDMLAARLAEAPDSRPLSRRLSLCHNVLGRVWHRLGDSAQARAAWALAAETIEHLAASSDDFRFLVPWAEALLRLGRASEARPVVEKLETLGYRHPEFLELRNRTLDIEPL